MRNRFLTPAFGLFFLISLKLNAQGPGIVIDSAVGQTGQIVCVPVRAKGFVDVVTMAGSISWNPQVLGFQNVQNFNLLPGMTLANFNYTQPSQLLFSWSDPNALCITKDDGEVVFEICFSAIGPPGSGSDVKIDTALIETCPTGQNIWSSSQSPPGHVEVTITTDASSLMTLKQPTLTLSPNPTSNGAQVIVQSQKESEAKLFVTNTLGQIIFEQKVSVKVGENQIQIPAEALKTAGFYQVSLQTEQGAISQLLVVK